MYFRKKIIKFKTVSNLLKQKIKIQVLISNLKIILQNSHLSKNNNIFLKSYK